MSVPSQQAGAYARVAMVQKVADQLRQVLVPDLQQLVGDPQTHLVTLNLVQRYLQQNQLIFDEQTLRSMFAEADFRKESGLSSGSLAAALQGRSASALGNGNRSPSCKR